MYEPGKDDDDGSLYDEQHNGVAGVELSRVDMFENPSLGCGPVAA